MKTQVVNLDGSQASVRTIAFKRYGIISLIANVPVFGPLSFFNWRASHFPSEPELPS